MENFPLDVVYPLNSFLKVSSEASTQTDEAMSFIPQDKLIWILDARSWYFVTDLYFSFYPASRNQHLYAKCISFKELYSFVKFSDYK